MLSSGDSRHSASRLSSQEAVSRSAGTLYDSTPRATIQPSSHPAAILPYLLSTQSTYSRQSTAPDPLWKTVAACGSCTGTSLLQTDVSQASQVQHLTSLPSYLFTLVFPSSPQTSERRSQEGACACRTLFSPSRRIIRPCAARSPPETLISFSPNSPQFYHDHQSKLILFS